MNNVYNLGPFLISYKLITMFISGIFGYITMLVILKRTNLNKQLISNNLLTSILIFVIIWKFAGILFNFKLFLNNPFDILYLQGNSMTLLVGFIISIGYLIYKLHKEGIPLNIFKDVFSFSLIMSLCIHSLLNPEYGFRTHLPWGITLGNKTIAYHPIHIYFAIMLAIILVYLFKTIRLIGSGKIFTKAATLVGTSGLLVTFLSPQLPYIWGISQEQWIYIFIIIAGYLNTLKIKENKSSKE